MTNPDSTLTTRRRFLAGAGLTGTQALLGTATMLGPICRAHAQPASPPLPPHLRSGEILPDPDFTALQQSGRYIVGIRPYRVGGVRLELEPAPLESPAGAKYLIHNYGHGGAGITLSWGCASVVVDHVTAVTRTLAETRRRPTVAVIGTGVIGLTVAAELRRRWPQLPITIYAKDLDVRRTTSHKAAGQFEPSGIDDDYRSVEKRAEVHDWLRRARTRVRSLQASSQRQAYGIAERKNYTLDIDNSGFDLATGQREDGTCDVICPPRTGLLPFQKLNTVGREYDTWLINPTIMLPHLVRDLKTKAVVFRQRQFTSLTDIAALQQNIVVNCTGFGAKALLGDDNLHAKRGQLVVLRRTSPKQFYFFSGGCGSRTISYVFCRQNDIVIGGSVQRDNETEAITPEDASGFDKILAKAKALFDGDLAKCIALDAVV